MNLSKIYCFLLCLLVSVSIEAGEKPAEGSFKQFIVAAIRPRLSETNYSDVWLYDKGKTTTHCLDVRHLRRSLSWIKVRLKLTVIDQCPFHAKGDAIIKIENRAGDMVLFGKERKFKDGSRRDRRRNCGDKDKVFDLTFQKRWKDGFLVGNKMCVTLRPHDGQKFMLDLKGSRIRIRVRDGSLG